MQTLTMSESGLALTKQFEGLRLEAYQDAAGIWTIGYGHTGADVSPGRRVTVTEAETLLRSDLRLAVEQVNRSLKVSLQQHQFDAVVDFCFNVGCGHFLASELLVKVNNRDFSGAAEQFGRWVYAGERPQPGLERRRAAEAAFFRGGGATTPH